MLQVLLVFVATLLLIFAGLAVSRLRQPTTMPLWLSKVFISALSPFLFLSSLIIAIIGWVLHSVPVISVSIAGAILYAFHIIRITSPPDRATSFEAAFGKHWEEKIRPEIKQKFLRRRYVLKLPKTPDPVFRQDISFHIIPENNRALLCDIWQPPHGVPASGLAFIYLHGSAWTLLDKDYGTRTFFRYLTNQGHVVMDVAYRLFPETDMKGMVHDAQHAIAWMKAHAGEYGFDPGRVVIGGGSAGAHIALLTAYTTSNPEFLSPDFTPGNLDVRGVLVLYGESDLASTYFHTGQHLAKHSALSGKGGDSGMPVWIQKRMGADYHRLGFDKSVEPGMLEPMLGGTPDEIPDTYAFYSPINYVSRNCPATCIIQGTHDILAPQDAMKQLYARLADEGVPAFMHLIPQTDHAFDLIVPDYSPSAHNGYYDIERFLALMA